MAIRSSSRRGPHFLSRQYPSAREDLSPTGGLVADQQLLKSLVPQSPKPKPPNIRVTVIRDWGDNPPSQAFLQGY